MVTVFKGVTVFDGSLDARQECTDVIINNGVIADVGKDLTPPEGATVIEADGLSLMPGIIDIHTHYDAQITWDPYLNPSPALGVTTVVMGNCGFTIAPCKERDRDLVMKNLTQVEAMSLDVLRQGIEWDFESFPEYLDSVERRGIAVNAAAFLGHSALRTYVMGEAAVERVATDDEISQMCVIVRDAMRKGAVGFATSTAPQHNGWGGIPMPSRFADERELDALVIAMSEAGRGVFMLTKGNNTDIPYLETLAKKAGCPVMIAALLHNPTDANGTFNDLEQIGAARSRGHDLWGQISCCPLTMEFTLESAYPLEGMKAWLPVMQASGDELIQMLADRNLRQAVRDELEGSAGVRLFNGEWHKIELTEAAKAENRHLEHRSISSLAAEADKDPLDWMFDFAISEGLKTVFTGVLLNSDEQAVSRMIRNPNSVVGLSDAGAHLTFMCDAGYGMHLLGHWSRAEGVLSIEEAVHELTGKPAEIFGLTGRGRIARGYAGDLVLFDLAEIGRGPKKRVHDLPGGAARLTTDAVGLKGVWVNGTQVVDGEGCVLAPTLPGKLIRTF